MFVARLVLCIVVILAAVPAVAVEITVEGEIATISDLALPQPVGAGCQPGGKQHCPYELFARVGVCVQTIANEIYDAVCRVYSSSSAQVQVAIPPPQGGGSLWIKAVDHVSGQSSTHWRTDWSPKDDLPDPPFDVSGFTEGSTLLTVTGLTSGAKLMSMYQRPGGALSITLIEDGSWGDEDGEANGIIVTMPPRFSGPPHVLGGEIWTLAYHEGTTAGGGTWTADGLGLRSTVAVASHVIGAGGVPFISDLTLSNPFGVNADGWLRFVEEDSDWQQAPEVTFSLAPGETMSWQDVLASAFGINENVKGSILIGGMPTWSLAVSSRNYAVDDSGRRFGIAIPGQSSFSPLIPGRIYVIPGLRQDAEYRSNLIVTGTVPEPSTVELRVISGGEVLATAEEQVPAYGLLQINRVASSLGAGDIADGYIELVVRSGAVHAALSVVDGSADDAAYIVARPALEMD